ncbi:MAG TPA: serine/threonine-protein kinase [Pyrinomonadaceae bacterium]|nr:serine/threonine-protein kinase [Pyrinomonadaceae bacterium]
MKAERWLEIETVLQDALDRPPLERASFIEDVCGGDEELKSEATTLIAAYEEAADFIEQPAIARDAYVLLDLTDNAGREIGPYRIVERLGAGGMGEVYLAQDTRLNRLVALKLLPVYFASDEERLRRFQSEARAASALNHPNILTIYEVGESDGVYYIATEFIDGKTIGELMREQKLSLAEIMDCVEQVASALAVAHAAGIVHRDIKPDNIMRRHDGLLKILDFGIAKLSEPAKTPDDVYDTAGFRTHTEAGLVLGTVNYMSPEQARGLSVDERTDIWSLGVVLYEMLARRLPFSGATRMDTMVAILDREPARLCDVAKEHVRSTPLMQSIVDKCLSKEISGRYRTVSELLADLRTAREQLTQPATEQQTGGFSSTPLLSRRFVAPALGLVLLVAIAIAGTLLYRRSATPNPPDTISQARPVKLYSQMSERERLDFIAEQEQRISSMMGERPVKLDENAVRFIKRYVDYRASKMIGPRDQESGSLIAVYERAPPYVPMIARSFAARKVPVIIGIYLPVIESGYKPCSESQFGAKGLYQFLPSTAQAYGVSREEMCDAEKMTPAAAHYIADRMAELGEDSQSVTLVLLSYNRGAEWVRDSLRQLRGTENYARNYWTLLANRESLDEAFRNETERYVPSFFAAAIIGENPAVFGLKTPPLSTLAKN